VGADEWCWCPHHDARGEDGDKLRTSKLPQAQARTEILKLLRRYCARSMVNRLDELPPAPQGRQHEAHQDMGPNSRGPNARTEDANDPGGPNWPIDDKP
jgi:hypothetical protein